MFEKLLTLEEIKTRKFPPVPGPGPVKKTAWLKLPKEFWKHGATDLTLAERCVLISLHCYRSQTGKCNPSIRKLAKGLGIGTHRVQRAISGLSARKLVRVEPHFKRSNDYFLADL